MRKFITILCLFLLVACVKETQVKRPVFKADTFPKVDGSTVTIPFSEALFAKLTDSSLDVARASILHNKTHMAYLNLFAGNADLIFVTSPSVEELALALASKFELEVVPITSEAFVFIVQADNPVESLTLAQIQKIYTGEIKNWKEVGGKDLPIVAYQRPVNSGSQTGFLDLVMKGLTPTVAPVEQIAVEMGDLIDIIAGFRSDASAIGYSYYYFVTDMWKNDKVKLLKVDGVYPDKTTISQGTYPIATAYYAVFDKAQKKNSDVRNVVEWILSPDGQRLVEDSGYVKVK
jgi:phosphate transport system substrate-binding protein